MACQGETPGQIMMFSQATLKSHINFVNSQACIKNKNKNGKMVTTFLYIGGIHTNQSAGSKVMIQIMTERSRKKTL